MPKPAGNAKPKNVPKNSSTLVISKPVWLKVEEIKPFPLSPCDAIYTHAAATVKQILGMPLPGFAYHYQDYGIEFCIADEDRAELGRRILEKIKDKKFTDHVVQTGLKTCDEMLALAEPFHRSPDFSDADLADRYEQYTQLLGKSMGYGYLGNLLDYASDDVDNVLLAELEKRVDAKIKDRRQAIETLVALTTPEQTTYPNLEHQDFLKLAIEIFKDKKAKKALMENDSASVASATALPSVFALQFPALSTRKGRVIMKLDILPEIESPYLSTLSHSP